VETTLTSPSLSTPRSALSNLPDFITNPRPEIYVDPNSRFVVLDFETEGWAFGDAGDNEARLVLACWMEYQASRSDGFQYVHKSHYHFGGEFDQDALRRAVESADFIVAHNAKYELKWLQRMGVDTRRVLPYCTQVGEYVLAGNIRRPLDLNSTAKRYGLGSKRSWISLAIKSGAAVGNLPESLLREYCEQDVELTVGIFLQQRQLLKERDQLKTAYARNIVTPALADIEFNGAQLDAAAVQVEYESVVRSYDDASGNLDRLTGGINFRSPKQLREFIYGKLGFEELSDGRGKPLRTATGELSTNKDTVAALKAVTQEQRDFKLAIKALAPLKKQHQILKAMVKCCKEGGVVYAAFNQTVTQTHRLSSTGGKWGFQFHNFPRVFKKLFKARREGWVVCEADAPQLEFRVAGDLGQDRVVLDDVQKGVDVHAMTSSVMDLSRQDAKAFTFKPLYGGNSGTAKAKAYFKAFRERYKATYDTQMGWVREVVRTKKLRIPSGLEFSWPDTEVQRSGYITNTPSIFNYPVQSFATADIIPLVLVLVWHKIKGMQVMITNTIHDSIIAEVPPDEVERYRQILIESFTKDIYWMLDKLYGYKFKVPLGVGIKFGSHWGVGQEEKYGVV
jgi:DNA polymerase I-like protein with 3'-5' exonuclease and polymerase domains